MSDHSKRDHARLSASGAHRWLNCTPSARLEEQFPDTTSEAAKEGTLAHEICELKLSKELRGTRMVGIKKLRSHELYKPEMEEHTDQYVTDVMALAFEMGSPYVAIEQRLDLSAYIPEGFGTADCILIAGSHLAVVDFKYGKGVPVSAEHNPQMMLYALGAYEAYKLIYSIDKVSMHIVQPRISNSNSWTCGIEELLAFGDYVKERSALAGSGEGEFAPGDWCKFCRARQNCRARADANVRMAFFEESGKKPDLLTPEEIGAYIDMGEDVAAWLSDLKDYALAQCLAGQEITGYKAVAGRSTRSFDDADAAFADLIKAGVDEAILYERKPLTLAKIEKTIGKKAFESAVGSRVVKAPGKPTLVKSSDIREAITNEVTAAEAFG